MTDVLTIWTVYKHPSDHPDKWVLRGHDIGPKGSHPRAGCYIADSYEEIIRSVPLGLIRMDRNPTDDPVIYEVWL